MHTGQPYFCEKPMLPLWDKIGFYLQNACQASFVNGFVPPEIKHPSPFHNVDIQPSNACPRNFIIFDQTYEGSHVMYHPEISSTLRCNPKFGVETSFFRADIFQKEPDDDTNISSSFEEDYNGIDALLSSENEKSEEVEDDEVSTARTGSYYDCSSPDSCSNYETVPKKQRTFLWKSSGIRGNEMKKHKRMREMVKALRGIVPGANRLGTVAVLDESIRYLKSLKADLKLEVQNFKG